MSRTFELDVEEGGVVTLPDEAVLHLGYEPGSESQIECEVHPDGTLILLPRVDLELQAGPLGAIQK